VVIPATQLRLRRSLARGLLGLGFVTLGACSTVLGFDDLDGRERTDAATAADAASDADAASKGDGSVDASLEASADASTGPHPSCAGLAPSCGPAQSADCCASVKVPGGSYLRSHDVDFPATVSDFTLDLFEVTVGRFRAFVNAGKGTQASPPAEGDGTNPKIAESGWLSKWSSGLATTSTDLRVGLHCSPAYATWTETAGPNENRPINCLTWPEAFAFCAWDGGFLPTDAQFEYAAQGGEQRNYPWGNTALANDAKLAIWDCRWIGAGACTSSLDIAPVGSVAAGNGRWGHADLSGNVYEWVLDYIGPPVVPCTDCALLPPAASTLADERIDRGGSFSESNAVRLTNDYRGSAGGLTRSSGVGVRCAGIPAR
jgi:formylglycine-generating enzyme required for sulfatase activity